MVELLLMRHAKSSWEEGGLSDHDRPLNARGLRAAPRMGHLLREQGLVPELIVTSTARRAIDTTHAVVTATGFEGPIEVTRRLYLAPPEGYLAVLTDLAENYERLLMIGHNPGITELVTLLTGADEPMPTAAIAHIELSGVRFSDAPPRCGILRAVFRPKELDAKELNDA